MQHFSNVLFYSELQLLVQNILQLFYCFCWFSLVSLDMPTAISYLSSPDVAMQVLGAAYIQHQCYHSSEAKELVNTPNFYIIFIYCTSKKTRARETFCTSYRQKYLDTCSYY